MHLYESTAIRWVQKAEMPEDCLKSACAVWDEAFHFLENFRQQNIKYKLHINRWVQIDCVMDSRPFCSFHLAAVECNGKLYWLHSWQEIAEFDPHTERWMLVKSIQAHV
jgi:hypothetical protein